MSRNQLVDLFENTFRREEVLYLACNEECAFFASEEHKNMIYGLVQKALIYLLDNIYIIFGSKLFIQNVGIPMETYCAPLVADLFLFCYERDFMKSPTEEKRYELIDAFNSTSRYLDDLLNIDNIHFEHMVHRIYPAELQLNKADASDTAAAFLYFNLSIYNEIVLTKIYDKRDDFNYTPRKLCLWEGILFSRCPKVRPTHRPTVCPKRFVSLITSRIIDGISSNFANTFIYTGQILLIKK